MECLNLTRFEDSNDSAITLSTTEGGVLLEKMRIKSTGAIQFNNYGSGTHTGTEAYTLGVDSSGNIIETASSGGGGGIFYGDQAIVTGSSDLTFTLTRATTARHEHIQCSIRSGIIISGRLFFTLLES